MSMNRHLRFFVLIFLPFVLGLAGFAGRGARPVPPILFVSRKPAADREQIPGMGPHGRTVAPGGELLLRGRSGRIRPFLKAGRFFDVCDPAVSWDGKSVAFSAKVHPDSAWRIWTADERGANVRPVTTTIAGDGDDIDPTWLPNGTIVFASTRYGMNALADTVSVTNLFVVHADGSRMNRITLDRNGAEEPTVDVRNGRIVYARWWFNPFRATDLEYSADDGVPLGSTAITRSNERAIPADPINFWQAIAILPDGDGIRLAGGYPPLKGGESVYQPAMVEGTLVGIDAANRSLTPAPGTTKLVSFAGGFEKPEILTTVGRAAAPAALPDGRIVFSWDRDGSGDMDLYVVQPGAPEPVRLGGVRDRLDLDPAVLEPRRQATFPAALLEPAALSSAFTLEDVHTANRTFRFDCLNVFMNAPVDAPFPDAPPIGQGVRIRFYTLLSRPETAGGDSLVLIREAPVTGDGAVHEHELPADIPMFEQLVDKNGRVLRNAHGLAHVPGFNFARAGSGTKCVGCHTGHSAITVPKNYEQASWFNAAPSARVTASSSLEGTIGPRGAVDRRTKGPVEQVSWIAAGGAGESVTLEWPTPVKLRAVILYTPRDDRDQGTELRVDGAEIVFTSGGSEVGRARVTGVLAPGGSKVVVEPVTIDALTVKLGPATGTVHHRPAAALAEVEVETRLAY